MAGVVEAYADLVRWILDRPARLGRTRLVAVDGPSGAGKSVFAERLAEAFSAAGPTETFAGMARDRPPIVHTDDLLDGWMDQFTFWSRLEEWVLAPLRAGRTGYYRSYDWDQRRFGADWTPVPPAPVVILEGFTAARATIRPELTFAVFVTAPDQLRLDRALTRDGAAIRPQLDRWRRAEHDHLALDDTAGDADLIVDGAPEQAPEQALESAPEQALEQASEPAPGSADVPAPAPMTDAARYYVRLPDPPRR
ncbi:hypothetical protein ACWDV4_00385 [Micromonospora sp. NPDC003197]